MKVASKKSEGLQLLRPAAGLCVEKVKKVVAKPDLDRQDVQTGMRISKTRITGGFYILGDY